MHRHHPPPKFPTKSVTNPFQDGFNVSMTKNTRSVGLAFLLSALLVSGVAVAANLLFANQIVQAACYKAYTLACIF